MNKSFGQFKPTRKPKEFKTDTVDIFLNSKKVFYKEETRFRWSDNRIQLLYSLLFDDPCCIDEESTTNLTINFQRADDLVVGKDYNVADLEAGFEVITFIGLLEYKKPVGRIRLTKKTKKSLSFDIDVAVQSSGKEMLNIFRGQRVFRRSK